jgi:hypothetical protein
MPTTNEKMITNDCPMAWIYKFNIGTGACDDVLSPLYFFDNLTSIAFKLQKGKEASGTGANLDRTRADGAIIRFPKEELIIKGEDETQVITSAGGSDATQYFEGTLITQEAPCNLDDDDSPYDAITNPYKYDSWTDFLADLLSQIESGAKLLVVLPTGYSYNRKGVSSSRKADGFVYCIGMVTNEPESPAGEGKTLTLTLASNMYTTLDTNMSMDFSSHGIKIKRGGLYDIPANINYPPALDDADFAILATGKPVIKANTI